MISFDGLMIYDRQTCLYFQNNQLSRLEQKIIMDLLYKFLMRSKIYLQQCRRLPNL